MRGGGADHKRDFLKLDTKLTKRYKVAVTTIATLLLGTLAYSLVAPEVSEANAEVVTAVGSGGYTLTVSGAGTVDLGLTPTAGGTFIMGLETLNIKTNAYGYQAYLSTAENTTSLTHTNHTDTIIATNHTYANSPDSIDMNSWGFAIPDSYKNASGTTVTNSNIQVSGFGNVDNGFSAEASAAQLEGSTKWASIPEKGSPLLIQETSSANNTTGVDLGIFYASKANTSQSAGIYSGEVLYTVLASAPSATEASITPSTINNLGGDNTLTVTLGLNTTANDNIKNNSTVTIGDKACTVTGASNNGSGNLVLTCTDTRQFVTGRYDVTITVSDGTNNYGTYYISNGVEYRSVMSPHIQWIAPTAIYTGESVGRPIRVLTDIPSSDITFDSATVTVGSATCSSPTITSVGGYYMVSCTAPTGLSAGSYQTSINLVKSGGTLVDLNATVNYSDTSSLYAISDMQDANAAVCAGTPTPSAAATAPLTNLANVTYDANNLAEQVPTVSLLDTRDNQRYTVRKLADGNCWMTESLRYGAEPDNSETPSITPNIRAYNSSDAAKSNNMNTTNMANLTSSRISTAADCGSIFGNTTDDNYTLPSVCIYQANTDSTVDTSYNTVKFGALYNFCAASGGTVCSTEPNMNRITGAVDSTHAVRVSGSICPTGWSLPQMTGNPSATGGINTGYNADNAYSYSFNNLLNNYSITNGANEYTKVISAPLEFVRAGYAWSGSLSLRGADGGYWSSTPYTGSDVYAYFLYFYSSYVDRRNNYRAYGVSVRCVVAS